MKYVYDTASGQQRVNIWLQLYDQITGKWKWKWFVNYIAEAKDRHDGLWLPDQIPRPWQLWGGEDLSSAPVHRTHIQSQVAIPILLMSNRYPMELICYKSF